MKITAFDTETYLIGTRDKAPKPVCCTWCVDGAAPFITRPDDAWTLALWSDPDRLFVGVNIAYDILVMMRWCPWLTPHMVRALDEGRVVDCPIRYGLIYLATKGAIGYKPYISLADLAAQLLGRDLSATKKGDDIWRLKYGTLDGVPFNEWPAAALEYALGDAKNTYDVFMQLGDPQSLYPTEDAQNQAAVVLHATSTWGFMVDQTIRRKLKDAISVQIAALHEKTKHLQWTGKGSQQRLGLVINAAWHQKHLKLLLQYAATTGVYIDVQGWRERVNSSCDVRALLATWASGGPNGDIALAPISFQPGSDVMSWLMEAYRLLPEIPTTSRGPSTAEESLELIADEMPDAKNYVELKHKQKMMSTYIEPYDGETVHARFKPMVATGRTGCGDPNLQNIPRKDKDRPDEAFRTMFCARPGRQLGTVDYSQLELCTLAATVRVFFPGIQCALGEAIDADRDVHCIMGGLIGNIPYEMMLAGKKAKDPIILNLRQTGKSTNFGLPGGLGAPTLVQYAKANYGVTVTPEAAFAITKEWRRAWPEMVTYLADVGNKVRGAAGGRATFQTISGFTKANCFYTEGANMRFQGLAASGAKRAMWAYWRECALGAYWKLYPGTGYGSALAGGPLADSRMVNFVHDEIVGEHLAGDAGKAALKRQEALMVDAMTKECQNKITIRVEGALSDRWEH